jgi:hypothetical protein
MPRGLFRIFHGFIRAAAGICLAVFVWAGIDAALDVHYGNQSGSWPTTQGVVTRSRMYTETERVRARVGGRHGTLTQTRTKSVLVFAYRYTVNGREYDGQRISYEIRGVSRHEVPTVPYSAGEKVLVHYEPQRPTRSVLKPGVSRANFTLIWLCVSACAMSLYFTLFGTRHAALLFNRPRRARKRGFEPVIAPHERSGRGA